MLLRQIRYFQSVVETGSFSEAGEMNYISQSAISQQIKALENELGVQLLQRHNRTFSLTPAGEMFYRKSLVILSDLNDLCREVVRIDKGKDAILSIGYLKCYGGSEFSQALSRFSEVYPNVRLDIVNGNHEDLYDALINEKVDLVVSDQRRAFHEDYENYELVESHTFIEIPSRHPLAKLARIDVEDLKNLTCILIAGKDQYQIESSFYRDIIGLKSDFIFADTLQEARIMVVSGKGYLPVEGIRDDVYYDTSISRIPLYRKGRPVYRKYCAFWKKDNSGYYIESFAEILKSEFE